MDIIGDLTLQSINVNENDENGCLDVIIDESTKLHVRRQIQAHENITMINLGSIHMYNSSVIGPYVDINSFRSHISEYLPKLIMLSSGSLQVLANSHVTIGSLLTLKERSNLCKHH